MTNAFIRAQVDYGPMDSWEFDDITQKTDLAEKYFLPYVSYQEYGAKTLSEWGYKNGIAHPTGGLWGQPTATPTGMVLADGTFLFILFNSFNTNDGKKIISSISFGIDVNGPKPPNTWGKDIFRYKQFLQSGVPGTLGELHRDINKDTGTFTFKSFSTRDENLTDCKTTDDQVCGGVIQADGWRIADDYPWL